MGLEECLLSELNSTGILTLLSKDLDFLFLRLNIVLAISILDSDRQPVPPDDCTLIRQGKSLFVVSKTFILPQFTRSKVTF